MTCDCVNVKLCVDPADLNLPEKASIEETVAGLDDAKYTTPAGVAAAIAESACDCPPGGTGGGSFNLVTDGPEVAIPGEYWEGKQVYAQKINFGALPNDALKEIAHNIPNIDEFMLDYSRSWMVSSEGRRGCLNQPGTSSNPVTFWVTKTTLQCRAFIDRRSYSAVIVVLYTKTTDEPIA